MPLPNNGAVRAPAGHLLSPYPIGLLAKGKPCITQDVVKAISCSLQTDGKATLLNTTSPQIITHGEIELLPT